MKILKGNDVQDILEEIGAVTYDRYQKTNNVEEEAFYLGIMNVAAALTQVDQHGNTTFGTFCLDYESVKRDFEEAHKLAASKSKNKQMSIEDLIPDIYKAIDDYLNKQKSKKSKKE